MKKQQKLCALQSLLILFLVFVLSCIIFAVVSTVSCSVPFHNAASVSLSVGYISGQDAPERPLGVQPRSIRAASLPRSIPEPRVDKLLYGEELYQSYVDEIANLYFPNMDTAMVKALIYTESRYQPNVASSVGAVGLMQVIPCYHAWRMEKYGLTDIWDPYTNILVGMDLLHELYLKYGNWYDTLYFYSGGSAEYPGLITNRSAQYR